MRKKFLTGIVLASVIAIGATAAVSYNTSVEAKSQPKQPTPAERMAKYSAPKQKTSAKTIVRASRLDQQNIVAEAANVLNCLPIDIIKEMQTGKTLVQVAKDKGLSEADFNKKLTDFDTKIVDKAVKDGTITKEHGDAIKAGRSDRIKNGMKEKAMKAKTMMDMGSN
jgi:hypothetical protein